MRRGIKCKMFREKLSRASGSGFRRLSRLFNSPIDGLAIRINDCLQQTRFGWVKGLARGRLDRRRADRSKSAAPIRERILCLGHARSGARGLRAKHWANWSPKAGAERNFNLDSVRAAWPPCHGRGYGPNYLHGTDVA